MQDTLLDGCLAALMTVAAATKGKKMLVFVGLPVRCEGKLYNCAAGISDGKVLGVVPKTNLPNYNEFYEARHFARGFEGEAYVWLPGGGFAPMSANFLFAAEGVPDLTVACEICEDVWVADPPSTRHVRAGAVVIVNLSASNETIGKREYRKTLLAAQSGRNVCAYVYADAGMGESTTDVVFAGHDMIAEDSTVLAESEPFGNGAAIAEIDVFMLDRERRRQSTFHACDSARKIYFDCKTEETQLTRNVSPTPFVPADKEGRDKRCKLIFDIQAGGLAKRIIHTGTKKAVVGLSGGLDSALALAVTVKAARMAGLSPSDVLAVTMPCFGTTSRTRNNAELLAKGLGTDFREVPIGEAVKVHLRDIGHPIDVTDVAYENAQARERTQVLMDIANMCGGLVVGTGDLSEAALGWSTYNGDHMSMYCVNTSVPKTLVRYLVAYYADTCGSEDAAKALRDILDTPISPELIPAENGRIVQKTEEIVGSYDLNDFFLYYTVRRGFRPRKVLRLAKIAFGGVYGDKELRSGLEKFYRRFFAQQFKRSCTPDGPKVGSVALSPRGDWRMPSDACPDAWLDDLK